MSYILGINGGFGGGYQDAAAVLLKDGRIIAALEEERVTRIKMSPGTIPLNAIKNVLEIAAISLAQVEKVAFHGSTWGEEIDYKLKNFFKHHFGFCPIIERHHHHECHATSGFYFSDFDKALIFSMDTSGDGISARVTQAVNNRFDVINEFKRPNSFGVFYSMITQLCGFTRDKDEYKIMGLSAYGNKYKYNFEDVIQVENGEICFNNSYLVEVKEGGPYPPKQEIVFSEKLKKYLGLPQTIDIVAQQDLAASCQFHLERMVVKWIMFHIQKTRISNIILTGGVALNCLMNQKIMELPEVENVFIPPIAGDMGIPYGAACLSLLKSNIIPVRERHAFWGKAYSDNEIEEILNLCNIKYHKNNAYENASSMLADGKVIAWYSGKMEYGPRALGNRSILASPCFVDMKDKVNRKIKFRESFRPFGASVLEEELNYYFVGKMESSPYMTMVYDVKQEIINEIPAVVHEDGTCRIQTVNKEINADFYNLISSFKQKSGHGVLLNTSFNLDREPIVESPRDAVASFFSSGLDALVFNGKYLVVK